jgi:hypothetical protein
MQALRHQPRIPGSRLLVIVEKIFQGDPAGTSFEALIADAQREWAASSGRRERAAVRARTIMAFWRALLLHFLDRLLTPPDWPVVHLVLSSILMGLATAEGLTLAFQPNRAPTESLTSGLVMMSGVAAFVLHPATIARHCPAVPDRGWWYYVQFLAVWFPMLASWLWIVEGTLYQLVTAVLSAAFGCYIATHADNERLSSTRR